MKSIGKILLSTMIIATSTTISTPIIKVGHVEAASSIKTMKTAYMTTANLNIRKGAGTKYSVLITVPKGKIIYSTEMMGSWKKVSYTYSLKGKSKTVTGWVSGTYLKEYYDYKTTKTTYYVTKKTTKLYTSPDTKKKAVYTLPTNNGLTSTQQVKNSIGETWLRVSYKGKNYYLNNSYVNKVTPIKLPETQFISINDTFIYNHFGTSHDPIVKIPKDTIISTTYSLGDWYRVTYSGKTGYVHKAELLNYSIEEEPKEENPVVEKPDEGEQVSEEAITGKTFLITANLNLQQAANESSKLLATIPNGKIIAPTHKTSNDWYKVIFEGKTGYVIGNYLTEVKTGDPMTNRDGYQFIDLRTKSKVTASEINKYIENYILLNKKASVLTGKGQAFIDAGNKYGVNALYLAAHAIHESAFGTSALSFGKFNLFGYGAYDAAPFLAAVRFSSVEQNIDFIAQEMKATYLNPNNWKHKGAYLGFSTKTMTNKRIDANSEGMNFYYASDPNWGAKIASHMQKILSYDKNEYSSAQPNTTTYLAPTRPIGSDIFPADISAVAKKELDLKAKKGDSLVVGKIKKDEEFMILEKTNDYWVKVKFNNKEYWISSIKFDIYTDYILVKNLGRVNVPDLNFRPAASTNNKPISQLNWNQYVQLVLDKNGNPTMDSTKNWYQISVDGTTGWVSASYIARELK